MRALRADHTVIGQLLVGLRAALERAEPPEAIERHLDGIGAIMESHFRYEERSLLRPLAELDLEEDPGRVFGPLA